MENSRLYPYLLSDVLYYHHILSESSTGRFLLRLSPPGTFGFGRE